MKFYIIGQGLAGSMLAYELLELGFDVMVLDDGHSASSSMVAAGMWNPVTFKKLSESWMASTLLSAADKSYTSLEKKLSRKFYHPMELVRIFTGNLAANDWEEKSVHPELISYLTDHQDEAVKEMFHQPFGHGIVAGSGWLDIPTLLHGYRDQLISQGRYEKRTITAETIEELEEDQDANVVHCIGWKAVYSGLFDWVPVIPNKGEVLTIELPKLGMNRMVNFGNFIVPIGQHKFRFGATYKLNEPDPNPQTETAREMLDDLHKVYPQEVVLLDHKAGYRPTTPDRKPVMGQHPSRKQHWIFNGFGSKGVLIIPFFAKHFAEVLAGQAELNGEVNVQRYWNRTVQSHAALVSSFREDH